MSNENNNIPSGQKPAPVIKKKKGVNTTTLIVSIVCAVVVLACVWFVGFKLGWWHVPAKASFTVDSHETIDIEEISITNDSVDTYVTRFTSQFATTTEETTGTVEDGDTVHITYVGTKDGVAFDGGTSGDEGADLTIGSGQFIDGFESGLIGKKIGEDVTLNLTFPEDYSQSPDLAGQDVVFEVSIQSKKVTNTPDFTDEFVKTNSLEYTTSAFGESKAAQLDTVNDFRAYIYDYLYNVHLDDSIEDAIRNLIHVKTYDEKIYDKIYNSQMQTMQLYGQYYGGDADTLAQAYGYTDAAAYCKSITDDELAVAMVYGYLAEEFGISHTEADIDAKLQEAMDENGYTGTLEEFKEQNGEEGLYYFKNFEMNYDEVMDVMRERVNFVPAQTEETTEETTAAN